MARTDAAVHRRGDAAIASPASGLTVRGSAFGATAPQPGVPIPAGMPRLPRREPDVEAALWWLGVHGGAGESTLATFASATRPAGHAWPVPAWPDRTQRVVLVARGNYSGLVAAQSASIEWAAGTLGDALRVEGLVIIADAPGLQPKVLRELVQVVAGGVPRLWHIPWISAWRSGPVRAGDRLPSAFRQLFSDLSLSPRRGVASD
jgi:hypothetical protein